MSKSTSSNLLHPLEFGPSAFWDIPSTTYHLHNRTGNGVEGHEQVTGACTVLLFGECMWVWCLHPTRGGDTTRVDPNWDSSAAADPMATVTSRWHLYPDTVPERDRDS
jgi:hypothetical protein